MTLKRLLILLFVSLPLYAQTYYVSPTGNDSDPGTLAEPFLTWGHFGDICGPGDTLFVRAGTYSEFFRPYDAAGTAGNEIVILNYPGESPVMDGYGTIPNIATHPGFGLIHFDNGYWKLSGITVRNSGENGICGGTNGSHTTVSNCTVYNSYSTGIAMHSDYGIVEDCLVYNTNLINEDGVLQPDEDPPSAAWGAGITGSGATTNILEHVIFRRNIVYDSWGEGMSQILARRGVIEDNTIYDSFSSMLYMHSCGNTVFRRNLVYRTKQMRFLGTDGIYVAHEAYTKPYMPIANDTVTNNMVFGCDRNLLVSMGVDCIFANNVFMNSNSLASVHFSGTASGDFSGTKFINNIVVQDSTLPVIYLNGAPATTGLEFSYNLWSKSPPADAVGTGDVVDNPDLTLGDSTAGNLDSTYFKLQAGSPAIDTGADWGGLLYVVVGSAYDLGAFERTTGEETPTITVSGSLLTNFGSVNTGSSSSSQNYTVSGTDLTGNISITAPTHFQVSLNNSTWTSSVALTPSGGTVGTTTVYARFTPSSTGAKSENITHVSPSATTRNVAVGGTGIANAAPPPAPKPTSPGVGKMDQPATVSLVWEASSGATSYRVQVSVDPTFATTIVDDSLITETTRQIGPLAGGTTHYWRVQARNAVGASVWFHPVWEFTTAAATSVGNKTGTPLDFELCQNYPNPFNPSTNISFSVPIASDVALIVVNILGQEVATPFKGHVHAGTYSIVFSGEGLSSGVYYYYMMAGTFSTVKRMILLK